MLVSIYIVLFVLGFAGMFLSFWRYREGDIHEKILLPFIVAGLFLSLGLVSGDIEKLTCENSVNQTVTYNYTDNTTEVYTNHWSCYRTIKSNVGLIWLWWALGLFMLTYAVAVTLIEVLTGGVRDMERAQRQTSS